MKRKLLVLLLALCMLFLASCDIREPLESISNMIYEAATNIGGQFLKETTYTSTESEPPSEESSSDEPSESESTESEDTAESTEPESTVPENTESSSTVPDIPDEPEPDPLPTRNPASFDKLMGTGIDYALPNNTTTTYGDMFNLLKNEKYFSFVRIYKDFDEGIYTDNNGLTYKINEQMALTRAGTNHKCRTSLILDIKFQNYAENVDIPTSKIKKADLEALVSALESAEHLTIASALDRFVQALSESEFTGAQASLSSAFTAIKASYAELSDEASFTNPYAETPLNNKLSGILADSSASLEAIGEDNAMYDMISVFDTALAEHLVSFDRTDEAGLKSGVDALLDDFLADLLSELYSYQAYTLASLAEPKTSYLDLAKQIYEYESRFGNKFAGNLRLIELGKHPEKTISAQEYAKIISITYDGDKYKTEGNVGIINAEAEAKIVLGALESPNMMYVAQVMQALATLRPDSQPLFVGAFNTEAFISSSVTPESVYLATESELGLMAEYRDELYPHVELFVSAFGYNTLDTESAYYASEQLQADYLLRSMLIFSRLGIDQASICQLRDRDGDEYNGFGVLNSDGTPKIAHYYLSSAKTLLTGYTFSSVVENAQGAVVFELANESGDKIYAVWNAVSDDSVIENVMISAQGECTVYSLKSDSVELNSLSTSADGWITLNATKTPQFVFVPAQISE